MPAVPRVYVLPRCKVELYATGADNTLGALIWTEAQVDNIRISERYDVVARHRTGQPYPDRHHTSESHELTFDAIWNLPVVMTRNTEYILSLTWLDASFSATPKGWVRRFYARVMTDSKDLASRDANEMGMSHTLSAAWMNETSGDGTPVDNQVGDPIC